MSQPVQKPHRSKQNYATPEAFMVAAKRRLGIDRFLHDFAADEFNAKALTHFDEARDALSVPDWHTYAVGGWGWLNPPYKQIGPWAYACSQMKLNGGSIAFLVPAAVGSNWFRDYVDGHALVLLLNGRIPFMPNKPKWLYPKDCILCLFSPSVAPGYEVWTWRAQKARQAVA